MIARTGSALEEFIRKTSLSVLKSKPALCRSLAFSRSAFAPSMIKNIIHPSAARSLASLGSAQLAPRCSAFLLCWPCLRSFYPAKPQRSLQRSRKSLQINGFPWCSGLPGCPEGAHRSMDFMLVLGFSIESEVPPHQRISPVFLGPEKAPRSTQNVLSRAPCRSGLLNISSRSTPVDPDG